MFWRGFNSAYRAAGPSLSFWLFWSLQIRNQAAVLPSQDPVKCAGHGCPRPLSWKLPSVPALCTTKGTLAHGQGLLTQVCECVSRCILHPSEVSGTVLSHWVPWVVIPCVCSAKWSGELQGEHLLPWVWAMVFLENLVFCGHALAETVHLLFIALRRCFGDVMCVLLTDVFVQPQVHNWAKAAVSLQMVQVFVTVSVGSRRTCKCWTVHLKKVSCCLWSAQAQRLSDLANPASHLHCVGFFFSYGSSKGDFGDIPNGCKISIAAVPSRFLLTWVVPQGPERVGQDWKEQEMLQTKCCSWCSLMAYGFGESSGHWEEYRVSEVKTCLKPREKKSKEYEWTESKQVWLLLVSAQYLNHWAPCPVGPLTPVCELTSF